jgi:hypothetical protein
VKISRSTVASLLGAVVVFAGPASLQAKRAAPPSVAAVDNGSVRYSAPAQPEEMGFVIATDVSTWKELWRQRIYHVHMKPLLEKDVQWVFITSLTLRDGKLLITNERDEHFTLDLTTRKVTKGE